MKDPVEVTEQKTIPELEYKPGTSVDKLSFQPTLVRLYGIPVKLVSAGTIGVQGSPECYISVTPNSPRFKVAVIYGYSYEGHCYSLPKPCFVVVDANTEQEADGCGYNARPQIAPGVPVKYWMWTADKLDRTLVLSMEQGFVEEIILQQNVSGPKAPAAYGTRVVLAHRGGKLSDY
jgi:hypothetical protein